MRQLSLIFILSLVLFLSIHAAPGLASAHTDDQTPLYLGVLLPLTGPVGGPINDAIGLAVSQINEGGGIRGRPVSLIMRDTRTGDIRTYAEHMVKDPRVRVIIGPFTSDDVFAIADLTDQNNRVLISPSASSDEIFRAFSESGSVWRTISNDGDITSVIMQHLAAHDVKDIALLTPNSSYGRTFYDWIPFWAIETGIEVLGTEQFSSLDEIPAAVRALSAQNPEYLIVIHSGDHAEISEVLEAVKDLDYQGDLYLVYPAVDEKGVLRNRLSSTSILGSLMSGEWMIRNTSVSSTTLPDDTLLLLSGQPDPSFISEFREYSGNYPTGYAIEAYDATLAAAAVLARFTAYPDKSPRNAAKSVLANQGSDPLPRTIEGLKTAFDTIRNGDSPVLTGATGSLLFKPTGTDRKSPWFGTYKIEGEKLIPDQFSYQALAKREGETAVPLQSAPEDRITTSPENFRAVIGALSRDWVNYRHQADALTIYQYLKRQGVSDDQIILLVYDDIPYDRRNKKPGEVYHTPTELEVRIGSNPDYIGDAINKEMIEKVLTGSGNTGDYPVLTSDENSTVLVYFSSHGAPGGSLLIGDDEKISPDDFSQIIEKMAENNRFKEMLVVLESCFSRETADKVTADNVTIMTASSYGETSKAATYDPELSTWLSNEFTRELVATLEEADPDMTVSNAYHSVYSAVRSSHPSMIRGNDTLNIPINSFFGG